MKTEYKKEAALQHPLRRGRGGWCRLLLPGHGRRRGGQRNSAHAQLG
jgi:hypothetical protein